MPLRMCGRQVRGRDRFRWDCKTRIDGTPNADVEAEVTLLSTETISGSAAPPHPP